MTNGVLRTPVCALLGCEVPIVLAGLGGVARSELGLTGPKLHIWAFAGTKGDHLGPSIALRHMTTFSAVKLNPCRSG